MPEMSDSLNIEEIYLWMVPWGNSEKMRVLLCKSRTYDLPNTGKDLMDIHTNHNSNKMTILNQFLELNIAIAIR